MKKIILFVGALLALNMATAQDRKVALNDIPATAINFVRQHFLVTDIASVWKDTDYNDEEYNVIFKDGLEIEFDSEGEWKEIKVRKGKLPNHIIPEKIATHVQANFPFESIREISRNIAKKKYEAELSDGQELKFNDTFNFIGIK